MSEQKTQRVLWLDMLRILAIVAMVMLHAFTGNFYGNDSAWRVADAQSVNFVFLHALDSLLRFCVPIFCMISGVFFLDPDREVPIKKLFKKNLLRIVIAYIAWTVVYAGVGSILRAQSFGGMIVDAVKSVIYGHYHLWFLLMLMGFYLVVPLLRKIAADKKTLEYFLLLCFVFTFLCNAVELLPFVGNIATVQGGKFSMEFVGGYIGYFMLGTYLYRFPPKNTVRYIVYALGIVSLVGTVVLGTVLAVFFNTKADMLYGYLLPTTLFETAALFLLFQSTVSQWKIPEKWVGYIGVASACSFGVYLIHDIFNMLLHRIGINALFITPILTAPLWTALVLVLSFVSIYYLRKIPLLAKYVS